MKEDELRTEIRFLKGVGPSRSRRLSKLGIETIGDLLLHVPRDYQDRRTITYIRDLVPGMERNVVGVIKSSGYLRSRGGRKRFQAVLGDGTGEIRLTFFNFRYVAGRLRDGIRVMATGTVDPLGGMVHPEVTYIDDEIEGPRVLPVYPLTEGITQGVMRKLVSSALERCRGNVPEILPEDVTRSLGWKSREELLYTLHFPEEPSEGERARRTLALEEFYVHQSLLQHVRARAGGRMGIRMRPRSEHLEAFIKNLPFELTSSQAGAVEEIRTDLAGPGPMRRLLQGDVGSGKTVVAAAACVICRAAGHQSVIVAPTEVLASQHYATMTDMLAPSGIGCRLLTGGTGAAERETMLEELQEGSIDLLIGTHAVLEQDVRVPDLGLCIIDEQHKFGVEQRDRLIAQRQPPPHFLLMSATPIPRTLAMSLYGDLDMTVLREMPPGRGRTETRVVDRNDREKVYSFLLDRLSRGERAFVVYPLREASQEMDLRDATTSYRILKNGPLGRYGVGLLTGAMKSREKLEVTSRFASGEISLLVSTTVIEVGIDVPQATVMIVAHADRFGLSQLHQLRGRIGRSRMDAWCFLMKDESCSAQAARRLGIMASTDDGFVIAEQDLRIRGPGEIAGTRQHGLPSFRVASIVRDADLLEKAASIASGGRDWPRLREEFEWRFGNPGIPEI